MDHLINMALVSPLTASHPKPRLIKIISSSSIMWRRQTQQCITVTHGTTLLKNTYHSDLHHDKNLLTKHTHFCFLSVWKKTLTECEMSQCVCSSKPGPAFVPAVHMVGELKMFILISQTVCCSVAYFPIFQSLRILHFRDHDYFRSFDSDTFSIDLFS